MIAVLFALPEESRDFRRRVAPSAWAGQVRVIHCGVGPAAARRSIAAVLAAPPEFIIAAGFAGGLDPALRAGEIVVSTNFSSPALLARARGEACGAFAHSELPVETVAAKAALARTTGAVAVDMESAPIAAACARAGVPLLVVRAISDPAGEPLPVPFAAWFDLTHQRPCPARLAAWLIRHPSRIAPFCRFVRSLTPARRALAGFLVRFLAPEGMSSLP